MQKVSEFIKDVMVGGDKPDTGWTQQELKDVLTSKFEELTSGKAINEFVNGPLGEGSNPLTVEGVQKLTNLLNNSNLKSFTEMVEIIPAGDLLVQENAGRVRTEYEKLSDGGKISVDQLLYNEILDVPKGVTDPFSKTDVNKYESLSTTANTQLTTTADRDNDLSTRRAESAKIEKTNSEAVEEFLKTGGKLTRTEIDGIGKVFLPEGRVTDVSSALKEPSNLRKTGELFKKSVDGSFDILDVFYKMDAQYSRLEPLVYRMSERSIRTLNEVLESMGDRLREGGGNDVLEKLIRDIMDIGATDNLREGIRESLRLKNDPTGELGYNPTDQQVETELNKQINDITNTILQDQFRATGRSIEKILSSMEIADSPVNKLYNEIIDTLKEPYEDTDGNPTDPEDWNEAKQGSWNDYVENQAFKMLGENVLTTYESIKSDIPTLLDNYYDGAEPSTEWTNSDSTDSSKNYEFEDYVRDQFSSRLKTTIETNIESQVTELTTEFKPEVSKTDAVKIDGIDGIDFVEMTFEIFP